MHKYTGEQRTFIREFAAGHTYIEIVNAFNETFSENITVPMIKGYLGNHKIHTGTTGRFKKGSIPKNKGMKGISYPGMEKTWFKPGHMPVKHREVGSERLSKYGYFEVKIAEPNKWALKHRLVWEQANGKVPKGCVIIFKDRNTQNVSLENLALVSRSELARLNQNNLIYKNSELTEVGINIAKLMTKVSEKGKRK